MNLLLDATESSNMEWILLGILIVVTIVALFTVFMVGSIKKAVVSRRISFANLTTQDLESREQYAKIKFGNHSFTDLLITDLGIVNGNTNFEFTKLYKKKVGLAENEKIIIEQQSSIELVLTPAELEKVIIKGTNEKTGIATFTLGKLKAYVLDSTGMPFSKSIGKVRKMAKVELKKDKADYLALHPEASFWYKFKKKDKVEEAPVKAEKKVEAKPQEKNEAKAETKSNNNSNK